MGLGKTVQSLAWLHLDRSEKNQKSLPAFIICPTSLVENWAEEVKRFTPDKSILVLQGSDRLESNRHYRTAITTRKHDSIRGTCKSTLQRRKGR